jgi:DNA-binding response OmpR family regulator
MTEHAIIIEDDDDLATIFSGALEYSGYKVETILDGRYARERLSEVQPDLVILDMHLPSTSGADILTQIRTDHNLKNTIVILTTADARMGEAFTDMADYVLIKPITFTQLRDLTARLHKKK